MDNKYRVGVVGATGMVGQRFVTLLDKHPWFSLTLVCASARSAGKTYELAVTGRWVMSDPIPENVKNMTVLDADADAESIAASVDFLFVATALSKDETRALEERFAKLEIPVISNNSACRRLSDVPMIVPEINPDHSSVIETQRKRLGTKRGFIAVKSNCSIQSYVPAIHPLMDLIPTDVLVCTYQAVSGAGKTLDNWPEMADNVIPYISGEEEKSEQEPLKLWGRVCDGHVVDATSPNITAQCLRVPVSDGHMAAVFARFKQKPSLATVIDRWSSFVGEPQKLKLPSAPERFVRYFDEPNRPQTKLDRMLGSGMAVSTGRLREDSQYDIKFVCLSHNTLRGAAGGAVLLAELLCAQGYITK